MRIRSALINTLLLLLAIGQVSCIVIRGGRGDDDDAAGDDDDDIDNSAPQIVEDDTYWLCEYSEPADDYFFEFQTGVTDADGLEDILDVQVTVLEAGTTAAIDDFLLIYEQGSIWGGIVWEAESDLYEWCGAPLDVRFTAWDTAGSNGSLTLYY
jgi:hypothetical protein